MLIGKNWGHLARVDLPLIQYYLTNKGAIFLFRSKTTNFLLGKLIDFSCYFTFLPSIFALVCMESAAQVLDEKFFYFL